MMIYKYMYPQQTNSSQSNYYLDPTPKSKTNELVKKTGKAFYTIIQILVGLGMLIMLLYLFVLPINIVNGKSMQPNFCNGDIYFTYKLDSYFQRNPYKRGDVIAFKLNDNSNLIKRVVGLPGDKIKILDGKVYINSELYQEEYLQTSVVTATQGFEPTQNGRTYTVPQGKYYVLGDNRPLSSDSREFGPIDPIENSINGKVVLVIWPLNKFRIFDPNQKYELNTCK